MDDFEKELKEGFLEEAAQLLSDAEQCFLEFENSSSDPAVIEKIFRLAHNFKGSANAVGFSDVGSFAHKFESFLLKVKNKEIDVNTEIVNLLLKCNDFLRASVDNLRADLNAKIDGGDLTQELLDYIEGRKTSSATEPTDQISAAEIQTISSDTPISGENTATALENSVPDSQTQDPVDVPVAVVSATEVPAPSEPITTEVKNEVSPPTPVQEAPKPVSVPKAAPPSDESIRVSLQKVEKLINNVGETVILQTVLNQQKVLIDNPLVQKTISQLAKITKELQEVSMSLRMLPLKQTFQKMQRIVRDSAKQLNKDIDLIISGEETEIDKTILELLGDPLVHLIRNAVDHGIETGEHRVANGKTAAGTVWLNAYHRGENIIVEVRDDGRGLDPEKLKKKAIEKGILSPNANISAKEAHHLVFAPGFSTKEQVTDISGRGVGMDVVKTNIEKLKGEIQIVTEVGKGTTFKILLPLTLAIIDGVIVASEEDRFIIPRSNIYESVQPAKNEVHSLTGVGEVFCLRGENLPMMRLGGLMGKKPAKPKPAWESLALVVRDTEKPYVVIVDDILGQQQVVIKKLGPELKNVPGLSGGAILGDGRAALIVDLQGLAENGDKNNARTI